MASPIRSMRWRAPSLPSPSNDCRATAARDRPTTSESSKADPASTRFPRTARTKVDIRSESPAKLDEIAALLTNAVERALETENDRATGGKVTAKIKEIGSRPGGRLRDDAYILQAMRAVDSHLGIRSHLDCASTDANVPLSMGLPADFHRRGRAWRRRAHSAGVVSSGGPRAGSQTYSADVVFAAPRPGRRMTGQLAAGSEVGAAGWKVDGSLVAVTLVWGATFVLVKQALADVSTLLFLTLRFSIAAVALALIFRKEFRAPNARPACCGECWPAYSCSADTSCKPPA